MKKEMNLTFSDLKGNSQIVSLFPGHPVYVLGANGTGKSALMHQACCHNEHAHRILAHRQSWFESNSSSLTAREGNSIAGQLFDYNRNLISRWKDDHAGQRPNLCLFKLIDTINVSARKMDAAVRSGEHGRVDELRKVDPALSVINELFATASLPICLELEAGDQFFARKTGGKRYSISELSDGERNAFLIAAEVLTAQQDSLIIIDEPERHLHRSIISPFLSALFQRRSDCAFLISTHDVTLPLDNSSAAVLLVRECIWNDHNVSGWDADLLKDSESIPRDILHAILGARRTVLFVEGKSESLDRQIYEILFPGVSVIPKGPCSEVERVVAGIRSTEAQHWLNAYGLVDADNRTPEQMRELEPRHVYALPSYSVESVYYHSSILDRVAMRQAAVTGDDAQALKTAAAATVIENIAPHRDRLCTLMVLQKGKDELLRNAPDEQAVRNGMLSVSVDLSKLLSDELAQFDAKVSAADVDALIGRYKVRTTPVLQSIAKTVGFQSREHYERAVRKLLIDCEQARNDTRLLLGGLAALLC